MPVKNKKKNAHENIHENIQVVSLSQQADWIIKKYSISSSLAGLIPIAMLDIIGLMYVQRIMIFRLSSLYGVPFKKHLFVAWITTLTSSVASKVAAPVAGSALKLIPVVGNVIGGAGMATLGSASTYALGKMFQQHFEKGGTMDDFDLEKGRRKNVSS